MTFKELELFYALCDNPHISQLSADIRLTQSAISLAIKSLEKKLGEPLFDRIGKKLVLNERGRVFKDNTYHAFLSLQDAQNLFKEDKVSGTIRIASSKTIGNFIMPQIIYDFLHVNKNITIQSQNKNSTQIMELLKEGKIDMGFIESEIEDTQIIKERLAQDDLIVVSSDKSLKKALFIDELFYKKWILREEGSGTREVFLKHLGKSVKELKVFMEFSDFGEIKLLLQNNKDAISCLSKHVVTKEIAQNSLLHVKIKNIEFKRNFYCVYHKKKYISKALEIFKKFVKESM